VEEDVELLPLEIDNSAGTPRGDFAGERTIGGDEGDGEEGIFCRLNPSGDGDDGADV